MQISMELTPIQQRVYDFVAARIQAGIPPTRAEIAREFNWRSANAAQDCLRSLVRKGRLELSRCARGIRLIQPRTTTNDLLAAAKAALNCNGIHTTNPDTGETFASALAAAIANAERQS